MTNVATTVNPENTDEITVDISGITTEQRRLLKIAVGYPDMVPNEDFDPELPISEENPETIPNTVPVVAFVQLKSLTKIVEEMRAIEEFERIQTAKAVPSAVDGLL